MKAHRQVLTGVDVANVCSAVLKHNSSAGKEVLVEHLKPNNDDDEESITSY